MSQELQRMTLAEAQQAGVPLEAMVAVNMSTALMHVIASEDTTDHDREAIFDKLQELIEMCMKLRDYPALSGADKALMIYEEIDRILKKDMANPNNNSANIRCKSQCSNCCHISVSVSSDEAEAIMREVRRQGRKLDTARLRLQMTHTPETWADMEKEDMRCVLLGDDGNCTVYDVRPTACRKFFVVNDPELCDSKKYRGQETAVWYSLKAEVMDSAAMTVFHCEPLPTQLLKAMNAVELA